MTEASTYPVAAPRRKLVEKFAERFSIEPGQLMTILKRTAFKVQQGEVSNEQMAALLVVADQYGLNPFTREIFAFEDKFKGIVPVVSVDGWSRIINDHKDFDGVEFVESSDVIDAPDGGRKAFLWIECVVHHKSRKHPTRIKEYFDEVYQPPRGQNRTHGPWQTHPKRMHRHKALIQCARVAFGFSGIYDEDEAQRIVEAGGPGMAIGFDIKPETPAASRTEGLAASLAQRANAKAAETVDPETGEIKPQQWPGKTTLVSPEIIILAIEGARSQDELQPLMGQIMEHPAGAERVGLLEKWNKRAHEITPPPQPVAPQPAPEKPAPAQAAPAPAKDQEPAAPPQQEPAAPPATPFDGPTQHSLDRKGQEALAQEMRGAKTIEALDAIAERENDRKWPSPLRRKIYEEYTRLAEQLSNG